MAVAKEDAYEARAVRVAGRSFVDADWLVEGLQGRLSDSVLAGTPLFEAHWAVLFAYMHRRFGPPHVAGDDYKDLSARWIVSTPDPDVLLMVSPSLSGSNAGFCFEPLILRDEAVEAVYRGEARRIPDERAYEVRRAYEAALLDLLRPVGVRDQKFNPLGKIDGRAAHEWGPPVERAPSSGVAIPLGVLGSPHWHDLCRFMVRAGDGDAALGLERLCGSLRAQAEAEAVAIMREAPEQVRLLVLSQIAPEQWDMFGASDGEREAAAGLARDLARPEEGGEPFRKFADLAVRRASQLLADLGHPDRLSARVRHYRSHARLVEEWHRMVAAAKATGGEIPDAAVPEDPWGSDIVSFFVAGLDGAGAGELASWARDLRSQEDGESTLERIVQMLVVHKTREAEPSGTPTP